MRVVRLGENEKTKRVNDGVRGVALGETKATSQRHAMRLWAAVCGALGRADWGGMDEVMMVVSVDRW